MRTDAADGSVGLTTAGSRRWITYNSPVVTRADAARWMAGFEAAARADRRQRRAAGPQPDWSIALAQSLIDAARQAVSGPLGDVRRAEEDARVRETWRRLRAAGRG